MVNSNNYEFTANKSKENHGYIWENFEGYFLNKEYYYIKKIHKYPLYKFSGIGPQMKNNIKEEGCSHQKRFILIPITSWQYFLSNEESLLKNLSTSTCKISLSSFYCEVRVDICIPFK